MTLQTLARGETHRGLLKSLSLSGGGEHLDAVGEEPRLRGRQVRELGWLGAESVDDRSRRCLLDTERGHLLARTRDLVIAWGSTNLSSPSTPSSRPTPLTLKPPERNTSWLRDQPQGASESSNCSSQRLQYSCGNLPPLGP